MLLRKVRVKNSIAHYAILGPDPLCKGEYSIASVRFSDAEPIRNLRNQQISALRQQQQLSKASQIEYFNNIVAKDFNNDRPKQVLVRFCLECHLIGYGGIVHLDWRNLRGEVSFLLETSRTKDHTKYSAELGVFFHLIKELAFTKLGLNKLSTEAYAHRAYHVTAIENSGFQREGVLRQQTLLDGKWIDAVVASCLRSDHENIVK